MRLTCTCRPCRPWRGLGVDFATVQLTLSVYYATLAIGQLFVGSLSDRFGRRHVLLIGLVLFVLGSAVCWTAVDIDLLMLGRVLQGAGGCASIAVSRAVVRDVFDQDHVASAVAYVTMGMSLAPMLAPTIGGLLDAHYGWRGSFALLTLFGLIVLALTFRALPETRSPNRASEETGSPRRDIALLTGSRLFWGYALTTAFTSGTFFAFLAGAPFVMVDLLGRSAVEYGLYFPLAALGYIAGNFGTGRLSARLGIDHVMRLGLAVMVVGVALMALLFALGVDSPLALFVPVCLVAAGNGLVVPSGLAGAVGLVPSASGSASGLAGSLQMGTGAVISPLIGVVLQTTVWPLVEGMAICAILAVASFGLIAAGRSQPVQA